AAHNQQQHDYQHHAVLPEEAHKPWIIGLISSSSPQTTNATPASLLTGSLTRTTAKEGTPNFSTSTKRLIAATHQIFITPATKSSNISSQQQPVQYAPCLTPMTKAPAQPSFHSLNKKLRGDRQ